MRVTKSKASVLATAIVVLSSVSSQAQQPICAPPVPTQTYLDVCHSSSFVVRDVTRLLSRFSVDHVFKLPPPAFSYSFKEFVSPLIADLLNRYEDLDAFISGLAAVQFTRLDYSTGTLSANLEDAPRSFSTELENDDDEKSRLALQLPILLEGGYWRAPDVVQMAFWNDHRPSFTFELDDGKVVEGDVKCISLSASNLKIDLENEDQPEIVISFGGCE